MHDLQHTFKLAGDGYWGAEKGRTVTITGYEVARYTQEQIDDYVDWAKVGDIEHVSVMHDSTWDVYTDSAFVDAARTVTGIADLDFTEQGMQDDNVASMEVQLSLGGCVKTTHLAPSIVNPKLICRKWLTQQDPMLY